MNRYFRLYRDSMKRLAKMETIVEEFTDREPGLVEPDWKMTWYASHDSDWDQWVEIDYDEPATPPPALRSHKVTMAPQ